MKHLRFAAVALLSIIIIMIVLVKVGLFNCLLLLPSEKATNLNSILTAVNVALGLLSLLTLIVYTGFTGELVVADFKPKLYVVGKLLDCGHTWDKSVMLDVLEGGTSTSLKGPGFVYKSADKKWVLEVHNNGNSPATDIEVLYSVIAYKHEIVFGIDEADIKDYYPVKCAIKKETIRIDYIPPHSNQTFTVFFMDKFPKADLTIELLKCDGRSFITKPTRIATYFNQEFDCIEDSPHLRKMVGLMD